MFDVIKSEFIKMKRKRLFLLVLICEVIALFLNYIVQSRKCDLNANWMDILNNFNILNVMVEIILFTIVISKIMDIEYKSDMWKLMLSTVNNKKQLFTAKFICIITLVVFTSIIEFFGLIVTGLKLGMESVDYILIFKQCVFPLIGFIPFIIFQFTISFMVKNQNVSMACGVLGMCLEICVTYNYLGSKLIWAYPVLTSPMIQVRREEGIVTIMNNGIMSAIILSLSVAIIMLLVSLSLYSKKEDF